MLICASPNNRKIIKAEHGRLIPQNLIANLEPLTTDIYCVTRSRNNASGINSLMWSYLVGRRENSNASSVELGLFPWFQCRVVSAVKWKYGVEKHSQNKYLKTYIFWNIDFYSL